MKFTKEDACKDLMSKIPTKGETLQLSERSINEQLETLMPLLANEETELADFITSVLPIFKTADANVRANVSAQVKEYKEKNPIQEPPKKQEPSKKEDDEVAKLLERINALEQKNADNEKAKALAKRRSDVTAIMKEKGVKDGEWINDFLEAVSLDGEDFDAATRAESYVKIYNKTKSKVNKNLSPEESEGGGGDDAKRIKSKIEAAKAYATQQGLIG
jgi:hypothetical protein